MPITPHRPPRRHLPAMQMRKPFNRLVNDVSHILVIHIERELMRRIGYSTNTEPAGKLVHVLLVAFWFACGMLVLGE